MRATASATTIHDHFGVKYVLKNEIVTSFESCAKTLGTAVRVGNYRSRFSVITKKADPTKEHPTIQEPFVEFVDIAGLLCETAGTRKNLTASECDLILAVLGDACERNNIALKGVAGASAAVRKLKGATDFQGSATSLEAIATAMEDSTVWK